MQNAQDNDRKIGGYLIVWGSPERRDIYDTYFSPLSVVGISDGTKLPMVWYDHAGERQELGMVEVKIDEVGVHVAGEIDPTLVDKRNLDHINKLRSKGVLGWAPATEASQLMSIDPDGLISSFVVTQAVLTPTPSEPATIMKADE